MATFADATNFISILTTNVYCKTALARRKNVLSPVFNTLSESSSIYIFRRLATTIKPINAEENNHAAAESGTAFG
jgi:hypothetical protein